VLGALSTSASGQFNGLGEASGSAGRTRTAGRTTTAAQALDARPVTSLTLTARIVSRERQNSFSFRDASGTIGVEIEAPLWQNRPVGSNDRVRLVAGVDQGSRGRYLWGQSLTLVD